MSDVKGVELHAKLPGQQSFQAGKLATLGLWNWTGAVTSTYSDRCDLHSAPEAVLCEPNMDVPGAGKKFFAVENNLE